MIQRVLFIKVKVWSFLFIVYAVCSSRWWFDLNSSILLPSMLPYTSVWEYVFYIFSDSKKRLFLYVYLRDITSSWLSIILYQLPPSTTIHSILYVLDSLFAHTLFKSCFGLPLPGTLNFILHTHIFTQSFSSFHNIILPIPSQPVFLQYGNYVI